VERSQRQVGLEAGHEAGGLAQAGQEQQQVHGLSGAPRRFPLLHRSPLQVAVNDVMRWNQLGKSDYLKPGQELTLFVKNNS
jgi:hypothetical protein